jgi:actin related protein 2/3 complex subunit 2
MILLEVHNRIIEQALRSQIFPPDGKREPLEIICADFDGVQYHISNNADRSSVTVSLQWSCADQLLANGGEADLKRIYGAYLVDPEPNYHVTLSLNLNALPADQKQREELPMAFALLKRHLFGAPFALCFKALQSKSPQAPIRVDYRKVGHESVHLIPGKEGFTVVFAIGFESSSDQILSKIFLQEFSESRRMVRGAPSVKFSEKEPPLELTSINFQPPSGMISYVSFVLFDHHMNERNAARTISSIQTFRNYLHFHLKCSKAYMHSRMRKRVESLLQVLNRSRPPPFEPKAKKTIAGKTFTRNEQGIAEDPTPAGRGRGRGRGTAPAPGAGRAFGRGRA